jgi:hypothetical protein
VQAGSFLSRLPAPRMPSFTNWEAAIQKQAGAKPKSEAAHSIAVAVAVIFLLPFSAQKTNAKPLIHLTRYHPTTSAWHFSYIQSAILNI